MNLIIFFSRELDYQPNKTNQKVNKNDTANEVDESIGIISHDYNFQQSYNSI